MRCEHLEKLRWAYTSEFEMDLHKHGLCLCYNTFINYVLVILSIKPNSKCLYCIAFTTYRVLNQT